MESSASPVAGPCPATWSLENGLNHHGTLLLGTAPSACGHAVSPKSCEHTGRGHGRMREALSASFAPEGHSGALSRSAGAVHLSTRQTKGARSHEDRPVRQGPHCHRLDRRNRTHPPYELLNDQDLASSARCRFPSSMSRPQAGTS